MASSNSKRKINRALVLCGGGAKGAYTFGCLKAFKERNVHFDAVSGTSVGGLNALLWSTNSLSKGQKLWDELSFSTVYPVRFLDPGKHPKFIIRPLAYSIVFLNFLVSTMKGVKHPVNIVTALLLAIICSFPFVITSLLLLGAGLGVGGFPGNPIFLVFAAIISLITLTYTSDIFKGFHKGDPANAAMTFIMGLIVCSGYSSFAYMMTIDYQGSMSQLLPFAALLALTFFVIWAAPRITKRVLSYSSNLVDKFGTVLDAWYHGDVLPLVGVT